MKVIFDQFLSMPPIMRLVCFSMIFSPILALMSVLSGSISHPDNPVHEYGAAKSVLELILVVVATLPAFVGGILMLARRRSSVHLFAAGYMGLTVGPLFLSGMRESIEYMIPAVLGALVIGGLVYIYLFFSSSVRAYFDLT